MFPKSPIAEPKSEYVEARLHYDAKRDEYTEEENEALRRRVRQVFDRYKIGATRPVYLVLDPEDGAVLRRYEGAPIQSGQDVEFVEFLGGEVLE